MSIESLALLGFYTIGLVWLINRFWGKTPKLLCMLGVTVFFVWGILYLDVVMKYFLDPAEYTVADIMADVDHVWLSAYVVERFGALISLVHFGLCFLLIMLLRVGKKA